MSEVADAVGDWARSYDAEKQAYVDGPDLASVTALLDLAPLSGSPSLRFRMKLVPSEWGAWQATFRIVVDLDSTPVTPSFQRLKDVAIGFSLTDREASLVRGDDLLGRAPLIVEPTWGSGRVGQDLIEVSVPIEWLARRTRSPLPERKWPGWLGHHGRPLSYRVTVSTDERYQDRADSVPDESLPPALLPVPGW